MKKPNEKSHSVAGILAVITLAISIISFGFYTENNFGLNNNENEITGAAAGMEMVMEF